MRESAHKGRGKTDSTERVGKYNMKESSYKSYDELPLFLNAATVAKVLGVSAHPRRCGLKYKQWPKRDPIKNYFQLPNEIFLLGLSPGALVVYSYLLCCENRSTYQCWASYKTIGLFPVTFNKASTFLVDLCKTDFLKYANHFIT